MIHLYYTCFPLMLMIPGAGIAYLAVIHLARTREDGAWKRACILTGSLAIIQFLGLAARRALFALATARSGAHVVHQWNLFCNTHHPAAILAGVAYLFIGLGVYCPIVLRSVGPERRSLFLLGLAITLALAVPLATLFVPAD
jgi:hypothetical protein